MKLSPKARLIADLILLTGIVALSFLPVAGTQQTHFAIASGTLRIFAVVYGAIVFLSAVGLRDRRPISPRSRTILDFTAAALLALMSWAERFPAGNHITEMAIYGTVAGMILALSVLPEIGVTSGKST